MRHIHMPCVFTLLLTFCAGLECSAQERTNSGVDRDLDSSPPLVAREAFEWFDTLELPRLAEHQLVRVATGSHIWTADTPKRGIYEHGFLLEVEGDQFTVLLLDMSRRTFQRTKSGEPEYSRVGFEVVDLRDVAVRLQKDTRVLGLKLFVLARACDAAGHDALARSLFHESFSRRSEPLPTTLKRVQTLIAEDIAYIEMWQSVESFGNPRLSRKQLLARFRRIVDHFPETLQADRARKTAELLAQMVQEDESHAQQAKPLSEMTKNERIAELIFQLRDQNGHQTSQPGSCNIFADPRDGVFADPGVERKPVSAAAQLLEVGFEAIPQLIEALSDRRFTRSVEFHRDFYHSHEVLRVGDCAMSIIQQIASRRFPGRRRFNVTEKDDPARAQVEAWWAEVQAKGEKQVLIEAVSRGDDNAVLQAHRLVEIAPDAAIDAIATGAKVSENSWAGTGLVQAAAKVPTEAATALLKVERDNSAYLNARVEAAHALSERGAKAESVAAMVGEWQIIARQPPGDLPDFGLDDGGERRLIDFLLRSNTTAALRALAQSFKKVPVDRRLALLSAIDESFWAGSDTELTSPPPEIRVELERLLVAALEDTGDPNDLSGKVDGTTYQDPRVCDIAGHVLATRWKDKYEFDRSADEAHRDVQRFRAMNVWREEQGLPPVEVPKRSHK